MIMNKQRKITPTMQKVAVDILQDFEILLMTHNGPYTADEIIAIMNEHEKKYALCQDPFTRMICTSNEYVKNSLEYEGQIMMERYGHCDGLE